MRNARAVQRAAIAPAPMSMCRWRTQTLDTSDVVAAVVAGAKIVRAVIRGVLDVVLVLVGVLLGVLLRILLRVVGRVLLGVLGGVLLAEALPAGIVIIVDDGFAAETRARCAAKSAANAKRVIMSGKQPANRIGEKHTAGDPRRSAERTRQKPAAWTAALAAPRAGRGARR